MNKLKLYYAAITAFVGILGLGGCNQDDTTYHLSMKPPNQKKEKYTSLIPKASAPIRLVQKT